MNPTHGLETLDANLFVAFDALARERSVTRAAERMGVTQSAMSHTLRRLRDAFDDPLFVRAGAEMIMTPRAESLIVPVRGGLKMLSRALEGPGEFDPGTARRRFRVASPDLFDVLFLSRILARLGRDAPGIDLDVVPLSRRVDLELASGAVDLAITPLISGASPFSSETGELVRRTLFRDRFRAFVRKGHPAIDRSKRLAKARYLELPHLLVSPTGEGRGIFDDELAEQGLERRIALRVSTFSVALTVLPRTDLVLTAPASLQHAPHAADDLVSMAAPVSGGDHAIAMTWHRRFGEEPEHRWFRDLVRQETNSRTT